MDCEKVYQKIVAETRKYFLENCFEKAVFGLSSGVDSTLTAHVLKDALEEKNVMALIMPEEKLNGMQATKDAVQVCKKLGINYKIQPIDKFIKTFENLEWKQSKLAEINLRARIRMILLYNFANSFNALVVGTSNRSELLLGYFTKYGDGGTDFLPIGNLYKTEVVELAKFKQISPKILNKKPSAGLFLGQTDEQELGATYDQIDPILKELVDKKKSVKEVKEKFDSKIVVKLAERIKANAHKTKLPFVVKV